MIAESSVAGGGADARVTLATVTAGVCAASGAGTASVAAMNSLMIRVIVYFCMGGGPLRGGAVLLAATPDCALAFDGVLQLSVQVGYQVRKKFTFGSKEMPHQHAILFLKDLEPSSL